MVVWHELSTHRQVSHSWTACRCVCIGWHSQCMCISQLLKGALALHTHCIRTPGRKTAASLPNTACSLQGCLGEQERKEKVGKG